MNNSFYVVIDHNLYSAKEIKDGLGRLKRLGITVLGDIGFTKFSSILRKECLFVKCSGDISRLKGKEFIDETYGEKCILISLETNKHLANQLEVIQQFDDYCLDCPMCDPVNVVLSMHGKVNAIEISCSYKDICDRLSKWLTDNVLKEAEEKCNLDAMRKHEVSLFDGD